MKRLIVSNNEAYLQHINEPRHCILAMHNNLKQYSQKSLTKRGHLLKLTNELFYRILANV